MGGEVADAQLPLGLGVVIGFTVTLVVRLNDPFASIAFFDNGLEKTAAVKFGILGRLFFIRLCHVLAP